jgi:hypothetical protein
VVGGGGGDDAAADDDDGVVATTRPNETRISKPPKAKHRIRENLPTLGMTEPENSKLPPTRPTSRRIAPAPPKIVSNVPMMLTSSVEYD